MMLVSAMVNDCRRLGYLVLAAWLAWPAGAAAQALPNLSLLRVRYNTAKANARPDGALKAEIDAIDSALAEATRLGRTGEARRLLARGMARLDGRAWTPEDDYSASLVVRADRVFADPAEPYRLRLEQIYAPGLALASAPAAVVTLRRVEAAGDPTEARLVATLPDIPRDLREAPLPLEVSLAGAADGLHELAVEVTRDGQPIGRATLRIAVQRGLNDRSRALAAAADRSAATVAADIRYPLDVIRKVNRGLVAMGSFDVGRELEAAEALVRASAGGRDPFAGRRGDFERHYLLAGADEIMPYRVYVPTTYVAGTPTPLVIALHGLGGTEDSFFDGYEGVTPKLAERHGFLLAAPLGYRVDGFYGSRMMAGSDPAAARRAELSEQDVLEVLARMRAAYTVDADRIYLIGHSMGAIGTWALGARYPDLWAALAPISGTGAPATAARIKHIPQVVVHGDADPTVNVNGSRAMVEALRRVGAEVIYIEVPGGNHGDVVVPNLPRVFEFLATRRRAALATPR